MRTVNIGFNVETSKAVQNLKDFEKRLVDINKILEKKQVLQIDTSGIDKAIDNVVAKSKKTKDIEIISDKSINSKIMKLDELNKEISKMQVILNKPNNLDVKNVTVLASKLYDLTKRIESFRDIASDKDLMKGLNSKDVSNLNVEMKDLSSQTNKIKNTMSSLTDNSLMFVKYLENTNSKAYILETTLKDIKKQSVISGRLDVKSNTDLVIKDFDILKSKISSAFNTKDAFDLTNVDNHIAKINRQVLQLKKDLSIPIKTIAITEPKIGSTYTAQERPKIKGISSPIKNLRVMSLEIKDMVSNMNDKGFYEISKDADILNSKVLDLVSSFKKIKSESEIPELTHQFNILKNQLKDISKIQSESDMKSVKSILKPQKEGVLYGAIERPKVSGVENILKSAQIMKLETNSQASVFKKAGLKNISDDAINLSKSFDDIILKLHNVKSKSELPSLLLEFKELKRELKTLSSIEIDNILNPKKISMTGQVEKLEILRLKLLETGEGTEELYGKIELLKKSLSSVDDKSDIPKLKLQFENLNNEIKNTLNKKIENINMNSSISQLEVLQAQLKRLASTDPSVRLKGGLKDVSEETVKLIADTEKLRQAMASVDDKSDIPDLKAQLIDVRQEFNKLNNAKVEINPSVNKNALVDMISLTTIFYTLKSQLSVFMELEDATYDLGVVAQKSDAQIQTMRQTMIDMGQDVPVKIVEITKAMNETMRTGKSYSEAMNLVSEASKLAVASNEDLADSMLIVNKIFTALKINANDQQDVADAMQNLHATATFTATDLAGLGQSAKQWVGAVGVLSETTNKTGEELDDYRLKLMETGNAFSGILSNMGRASEQSGEQTLCPFVTRVA